MQVWHYTLWDKWALAWPCSMCPKLCNLCLVLLFCQIMSLTIAQYKWVYDHTPQESETLGFCYEIEEGCRVHVVQLSNSSHSSWHFLSLFSEKDCLDLVKVHWQICLSFLMNVSIQLSESVVSQESDMCSILRASQKTVAVVLTWSLKEEQTWWLTCTTLVLANHYGLRKN